MNNLIILKTQFTFIKNFNYLIYNPDNKRAILIDPAWYRQKYDDALQSADLQLAAIFITHHHIDHSNLAGELAKKYKCPVYMAKEEVDYYKFTCTNLRPIPAATDQLDIDGIIVKVIRTPGHTFGGACYMIDDKLFTGDTLFMEGCGMCNIPGGDPVKMFTSLQRLKAIVPDSTLIYPGHQYRYKIGKNFQEVKNNNVYLHFQTVDQFIKFRMRKGQTGLLNFS